MIEIKCTGSDTIDIDQLTEFQGALKERDAGDVEKIIKSIKKHGFSFPFFVWAHAGENGAYINHVFDGHGRLMALKKLRAQGEEIPELPCVYVSAKNEAEAKELLLKLNSQYGHMTAESVAEFLGELKIDFSEIALPDGVLDLTKIDEGADTKDDDEAPDVNEEEAPKSQRGEIYQLGRHRLICGDALDADDLQKLTGGAKADMILTDPPYNVAYEGKTKDKLHIDNDAKEDGEFIEFLTSAFKNMFSALKGGGVYYVWYANAKGKLFEEALTKSGAKIRQWLLWVKNNFCLGHQDYQWRHEPCFYGWKDGKNHYWNGRRDLSTVYDEKPNYKNMNKDQLLKEIAKLRGDHIPQTVIYEDKPARNAEHPTMKPVKLFTRLILNSSKEDDLILDPFGGSGTTIIAAEKTNRTAYVMELDPHYCDVIRKRWTKWAEENGKSAGAGALK